MLVFDSGIGLPGRGGIYWLKSNSVLKEEEGEFWRHSILVSGVYPITGNSRQLNVNELGDHGQTAELLTA